LANKDVKRTHISSQEVSIRQKLEPEEVLSLGHVLFFSPFISGGSFSAQEWNAGLPKDIEDIPDDLSAYIQNMALSTYDPNVPLPSQERKVYLNSKSTKPPEEILPFMNDKHLRAIATQDWSETKLCFTAKAWKYTVIACGSVLEAILLDALLGKPDEAYAAYKANHPDRARSKDLLRWGLDDLVDAAEKMKLIDEASFHLGHALRLHRDLVHPGRQLKEPVEVSEGEAQISKDTVEKCIRDFSARFREGEEREG